MKSAIVKRGVIVEGVRTSVSLEEPFWLAFKEIAQKRGQHVNDLLSELDRARDTVNLSSSVRLFVLLHYQSQGLS